MSPLRAIFFSALPFALIAAEPAVSQAKDPAPDAALAPEVTGAVVRVDVSGRFSGTGVVVTPEGHLITTSRTVTGSLYSQVTVGPNRVKAAIIVIDAKHDLVLLKAESPLPRWATLGPAPGPSKDEPARVFSFVYKGSDPPMIEFRHAPAKIEDPHYRGESAGEMDLSDLLIARLAGSGYDVRTDGSPLFSSKTGRLEGIIIGKMENGQNRLIAMPAAVIRTFLESRKVAIPAPK